MVSRVKQSFAAEVYRIARSPQRSASTFPNHSTRAEIGVHRRPVALILRAAENRVPAPAHPRH